MEKEGMLALELHHAGNNCAEALVKTCNECMGLNLSDDAIRMSSGLGGGLGGSGCVCGALNGACLILGVIAGRTTVEEKEKAEIYKVIKEFQKRFTEHFGVTCCRVLKGPKLQVSCDKLIQETAVMLKEYVAEKGLR